MSAVLKPAESKGDCAVADLGLADWGRKEIRIAETEMPGLIAIRDEYASQKPLRGARVTGSLHMTIQTAVLIETLQALGAEVRWASCNIYSTQDHAAAAIAASGTAVFAIKGESLADYWDYTHRIFEWPDGGYSNMILDDGGDATLLLHLGSKAEKDVSVIAHPASEEEEFLFASIKAKLAKNGSWYSTRLAKIKGVTEETTTGVKRLYQMAKEGRLAFPAINVNDSVTKSKFDNLYGCRESLVDGIKRATDVMIAGKVAVVAGYGDVGKGSAQALRALTCAGLDHRDRPDLRASGGDGRLPRRDHGLRRRQGRHLRDRDRQLPCDHTRAHVADEESGHRLQHRTLRQRDRCGLAEAVRVGRDQAAGRPHHLSRGRRKPGKRIILLAQGRLVNLGCGTGHPSYVMSSSFANQVIAQIELFGNTDKYPVGVYVLPKHLDEKVARLQLKKLAAQLTDLTDAQARYIGVNKEGPYKPDHYRY